MTISTWAFSSESFSTISFWIDVAPHAGVDQKRIPLRLPSKKGSGTLLPEPRGGSMNVNTYSCPAVWPPSSRRIRERRPSWAEFTDAAVKGFRWNPAPMRKSQTKGTCQQVSGPACSVGSACDLRRDTDRYRLPAE